MSISIQLTAIRDELKEIETMILNSILDNQYLTFPTDDWIYFPNEKIVKNIETWYQEKIFPLFPEKDIKKLVLYRISLGEKVAKIKFNYQADVYRSAKNNKEELIKLVTHPDIEEKILERVTNFLISHGGDPELGIKAKKMYEEIINITKEYQVYLINSWL